MTSKADKLPLEMEPVAQDNNTIFMLKPDDRTFVAPYSTDNGNKKKTLKLYLRFCSRIQITFRTP